MATPPVIKSKVFRFGAYELSPQSGEIRKHGVLIRLAPQPFQVLLMLLENAGELVTREELHQRIWGSEQLLVEFDAGLNRCIRHIRAALADDADDPRYIETEPRKGYRFTASVQTVVSKGVAPVADSLVTASPPQAVPDKPSTLSGEPALASKSENARQRVRFGYLGKWRAPLLYGAIAAVVPVAAFYFFSKWVRTREPTSLEVVPLASGLGEQYVPTFSPDGRQVAFTWNGEHRDNFDIYSKTIGQSSVSRLTTSSDIDYSPAWSPDGRWIAFCRGTNSRGGSLWLLAVHTGSGRKVTDLDSVALPWIRALSWLPDSRHLVVTERLAGSSLGGVTLIDVQSGERRQLTTLRPGIQHISPTVSPDGRTLAFTNDIGNGVSMINLLPLTGSAPAQPLRALALSEKFRNVYNAQAAWTPDSSHIVFSSNVNGEHNLWLASARSGSPPQTLAALGTNLDTAVISALGQLAAVHATYDSNIWRIELTGTNRLKASIPAIAIASTRYEGNPSISPDGSRVAFSSNRNGAPEIWVSRTDGSSALPLTSLHNPVTGSPTWSPDGSQIAFDSRAEIYIHASSGGSAEMLACGPGSNMVPAWSPDGRWIYYATDRAGRLEIWRVTPSGTSAEQITKEGGFGAKLSPDSKFLYFTSDNTPMSSLWRLHLQTGERKLISASATSRGYAPTSNGVYYFSGSASGATTLFFGDGTTNQKTRVFTTDKQVEGGVALSPDGRYFFFTQVDQNGHDLVLANKFWQ